MQGSYARARVRCAIEKSGLRAESRCSVSRQLSSAMTRSNRQDPDAPAADASAEARHGVPRRSSNGSAGRFPELTPCKARDDDTRAEPRGGEPRFSSLTRARFNVNGRDYELTLDPRVTLLDCLRERLGMMGTKKESARPALGPFRQRQPCRLPRARERRHRGNRRELRGRERDQLQSRRGARHRRDRHYRCRRRLVERRLSRDRKTRPRSSDHARQAIVVTPPARGGDPPRASFSF